MRVSVKPALAKIHVPITRGNVGVAVVLARLLSRITTREGLASGKDANLLATCLEGGALLDGHGHGGEVDITGLGGSRGGNGQSGRGDGDEGGGEFHLDDGDGLVVEVTSCGTVERFL